MSPKTVASNPHYGKVVQAYLAGVTLELIIVDYDKLLNPRSVKCIDQTGTPYTLSLDRVKGTGEIKSKSQVDMILAKAFARRSAVEGVTEHAS